MRFEREDLLGLCKLDKTLLEIILTDNLVKKFFVFNMRVSDGVNGIVIKPIKGYILLVRIEDVFYEENVTIYYKPLGGKDLELKSISILLWSYADNTSSFLRFFYGDDKDEVQLEAELQWF